MNVPNLEISSKYAYIGINSQRPPMSIRQKPADLQISQTHVENVHITKTDGKLLIDQSEAFASVGSKPPLQRAKEFYAKSAAHVAKYVAKTAQQGDQLMRIENNGFGKFAQIAASDSQLMNHEVDLRLSPKPLSVKINYQPGTIKVNVNPDRVDIKVNKNDPQITIPKWQTDVYVRQKNQLSIRAVGLNINRGL